MFIGFGYDVHKLVLGRKLILGGVIVPFATGLKGHSDADVLIHAIGDSIIGALGEGDIGKHFPDTWDEFKNISSLKILEKISALMESKDFYINNIDSTIVAQKPKLIDYFPQMKVNIAKVLKTDISRINIKATTTEGLGFAGKEEGIATYAVTTIKEDRRSFKRIKTNLKRA